MALWLIAKLGFLINWQQLVIEISDKPGIEEAEPAFKVNLSSLLLLISSLNKGFKCAVYAIDVEQLFDLPFVPLFLQSSLTCTEGI